jgi:hypothetical protein
VRKVSTTTWTSKAALLVILLALSSGCAKTSDWLKGRKTAEAVDPVILGAPEAELYLRDVYLLIDGDAFTQVEIFSDAKSAATLTPDPSSRLQYALILAAPGHAESDPQQAQSIFRDLLAQTELMTPAEVALATIHLKDVEERLKLDAETRRLRAENTTAANTEDRAVAQRMSTIESENRQLRKDLSEAEQKLEAITSIERSIREQTTNNEN